MKNIFVKIVEGVDRKSNVNILKKFSLKPLITAALTSDATS